jgi:RsmE family RNA methyltransferase
MNHLLLLPEDRLEDGRYAVADARALHLLEVLGVQPGSTVRVGLLNGPRGEAEVEATTATQVTLRLLPTLTPAPVPDLELLLALPRPRSLKKLLPEVTALGVSRIILTETHRVEKAFFGASFLRPEVYRPLLHEGLMQARLTREPEVVVERRLWRLLDDELPVRYAGHAKLVAHPDAPHALAHQRLDPGQPVLVAVGPEGGFLDKEVERLVQAGFQAVSMGERPLRVETACVALLAQVDLLRRLAGG